LEDLVMKVVDLVVSKLLQQEILELMAAASAVAVVVFQVLEAVEAVVL
jgi:hypothetical protein